MKTSNEGVKANSLQILVVDDNRDAAITLSMLLKIKGYDVHTCFSGQEALVVADQRRPQVIILDIGMPGLNGYETCHQLRQQPWGQDIITIALTGYGQDEDKKRSQEAGFNAHLIKPVDLTVLIQLINSLSPH